MQPTRPTAEDVDSDEEAEIRRAECGEESGEEDEIADHADDELNSDDEHDPHEAHFSSGKRRSRKQPEAFGPKFRRKSKGHKDCKNPEEAAARRMRGIVLEIMNILDHRPDIRSEIINNVIIRLSKEERRFVVRTPPPGQGRCGTERPELPPPYARHLPAKPVRYRAPGRCAQTPACGVTLGT